MKNINKNNTPVRLKFTSYSIIKTQYFAKNCYINHDANLYVLINVDFLLITAKTRANSVRCTTQFSNQNTLNVLKAII